MDDYDEMLAALFTFKSHRTKLLTESCIPDDEFDALEPGIYFQNGDVVYTEDFFEEN